MRFKAVIKRIPIVGPVALKLNRRLSGNPVEDHPVPAITFRTSSNYWEERYRAGGDSGVGSYEKFAEFKAEILNSFVRQEGICSVIEFGSGDGNQLLLAAYPSYSGYDVSSTAVEMCRRKFVDDKTKRFQHVDDYSGERAELALSLDVIYHLVEDAVFDRYMRTLFGASEKFVAIYSSNLDEPYSGGHVRHRQFTKWCEAHQPEWKLMTHVPNRYPYRGDYTKGSFADFYIYRRQK